MKPVKAPKSKQKPAVKKPKTLPASEAEKQRNRKNK